MSRKKTAAEIIAVMSLSFLLMAVGATTPALASIGRFFPTVDGNTLILLTTLPQLTLVPFSIFAGEIAGNSIGYRPLALLGALVITIAGIVPYILNDFTAILVARSILGAGIGLISPLPSALIMNLFEGKMRENLMGMVTLLTNAGNLFFMMIGGALCAIGWRNTFFAYFIGIPVFAMIFFLLPEPPKVGKPSSAASAPVPKGKITGAAIFWMAVYGSITFFTYPFFLNMSEMVKTNNLGNSAVSGFIVSMSTIGGMAASGVFGWIFRVTRRFTVPIGFALCAAGFLPMIFETNVPVFAAASFLIGFAFGLILPAVSMYIGFAVVPSARVFALSLMMGIPNLTMFLTSYFFSFIKSVFHITYDRYIFVIGLVYYAVNILILLIVKTPYKCGKPEPADPKIERAGQEVGSSAKS